MADDATGRESDKFMLRLPDGMRDRLKAQAEANKRSMNAEIVARLERSFQGFKADRSADPRAVEDMENAAQMLYQAAAMARSSGGRITLEVKVEGVSDDTAADKIGGQAYDAIVSGAGSKPD